MTVPTLGRLDPRPALEHAELLATPVLTRLQDWYRAVDVSVAEIDPELADTATFCSAYDVDLDVSANCVVVAGKRAGEITFAACVILATTRADVNGVVRRHLGVRKASFASMDTVVAETGMEYGGITPIGLPLDWLVLLDQRVVDSAHVVVGSGLRRSKIVVPGPALAGLAGVEVLTDLAG